MAWLIVFLLCLPPTSEGRSVDFTLQAEARGSDVVRAVQSKLDDVNLFDAPSTLAERQVYELFVRESAYVESIDGAEYPLGIRDGGIWRVSRDIFEQTQQYDFPELYGAICSTFCIDWMDVQYGDLRNPLYSGIAMNLYLHHLYNTNQRLQDTSTDLDRAIFWVTSFGQSRLVSQWLSRTDQLRRVEVCRVNTDVMFVLDSSASIRSHNYQTVRDYTYNFTQGLLNGNTDSRVGVILYSDSASVEIELDFLRSRGPQALLDEIRNLTYVARLTNTPEGLCLLKTRPWRRSVSVLRIAVVLTDGRSNRNSTTCTQRNGQPGTLASTTGEIHTLQPLVTVFAVGVANYIEAELHAIASSPQLVDTLDSFDYRLLLQNQQSRSYFICFKEQQSVPIGSEDNGVLSRGSATRLRFTGPRAEGVTVRICVDQGVIVVYGSYAVPNPSSALHDFSTILRAAGGEVGTSDCLVSHVTIDDVMRSNPRDCSQCRTSSQGRRKRQTQKEGSTEVTIYITIEGVSDTDGQFSVESSFGDAFECAADFCGTNGVLNRSNGSCFCSCVPGYEPSGQECLNIDECAVMPDLCGENGVCTDTSGNYTCGCLEGYQMEGQQLCVTIDSEGVFQVVTYVIVISVCTLAALMLVSAGVLMYRILRQKQGTKMDQ